MKTDTQIQKEVTAELNWEASVNPAEVGVQVKEGIVTLTGNVSSYAEKCSAEHAAQRVTGVLGLAVEIQVTVPGINKRTDADIAHSIENVLLWTSFLSKDAVKVMVEQGWVTLTGEVEWEYQRQAAGDAVRYLMGVNGVSNDISIKTYISAGLIKSDIEEALKRRARKDAKNISVEIHGSDVILSGEVHSWYERDLATNSAWSTPGVHHVENNMTIE